MDLEFVASDILVNGDVGVSLLSNFEANGLESGNFVLFVVATPACVTIAYCVRQSTNFCANS